MILSNDWLPSESLNIGFESAHIMMQIYHLISIYKNRLIPFRPFADVPYEMKMDCENNVQNAIYILATLAGTYIKAEYHTSYGRIDLLLCADRYIYIIELKYDGSSEEALRQIDEKGYAIPFATDGRKVIKIGANYSSEERTIDSCQIAWEAASSM